MPKTKAVENRVLGYTTQDHTAVEDWIPAELINKLPMWRMVTRQELVEHPELKHFNFSIKDVGYWSSTGALPRGSRTRAGSRAPVVYYSWIVPVIRALFQHSFN